MTTNDSRIYLSQFGIRTPVGPSDFEERARLEDLVRKEFERLHPDDTFEDLKRRAAFSTEDKYLLRDWMEIASRIAHQS